MEPNDGHVKYQYPNKRVSYDPLKGSLHSNNFCQGFSSLTCSWAKTGINGRKEKSNEIIFAKSEDVHVKFPTTRMQLVQLTTHHSFKYCNCVDITLYLP